MKKLMLLIFIPTLSFAQATSTLVNNNQFGVINETLPDSLIVIVENAGGNPVSGLTLNFEILAVPDSGVTTGQSLSTSSDVTDVNGLAGVVFTLGNDLGAYTVGVRAASSDTVQFTLKALTLRNTILELQRQIEGLINKNIKLIVAHESGAGRSVILNDGERINFGDADPPNSAEKTKIRSDFQDNMDSISAKALRAKGLVP